MNDCQKTQDLLVDAVDGRLSGDRKEYFDDHIQMCPGCRSDYELDVITKNFIRHKLRRQKTPADVALRIRQVIEEESQVRQRTVGVVVQLWRSPLTRAAVAAFLTIALTVFIYLDRTQPRLGESGDLMTQSVENYGLVLAGTIQPTKVSNNVNELYEFFTGQVDFAVALKPVKDCDWVGAVMSRYEGIPQAHLVYKIPEGIVYVHQVNWNEVKDGKRIRLSKAALASLSQTGWFTDDTNENYSVVLWLYGDNTICAAVSAMDSGKLTALFTQQSSQY